MKLPPTGQKQTTELADGRAEGRYMVMEEIRENSLYCTVQSE